jgi:hypothetical protein
MSETEFAPPIGDGKTEVAVGDENRKVVLRFPKPVNYIAMDPENALAICGAMMKSALYCKTGRMPRSQTVEQLMGDLRGQFKKDITKEHREVLIKRCLMMMDSLERQKKPPLYRAEAIVDILLSMSNL